MKRESEGSPPSHGLGASEAEAMDTVGRGVRQAAEGAETASSRTVGVHNPPGDQLLDVVADLTSVSREDVEQALRDGEVDRETLAAEVNAFAGNVQARWRTITEAYPQILQSKGTESKRPDGLQPVQLWDGARHSFLELNDTVFRFPHEERTGEETARELALLGDLRERLPGLVPKVKYNNLEAGEWYKRFIGYKKLPGQRLERAFLNRYAGSIQLAHALGGILSEVHATKLDEATRLGIEQTTPDEEYESVDQAYRSMPKVSGSFKGEDFEQTIENFFTMALEDEETFDFRPTLTHGNFSAHVLFDEPSRPAGIVGWSIARIGDPAIDLADVMHFVGPAVIADVFAPYQTRDVVEHLWKRTIVYWGIGLLKAAVLPEQPEGAPPYVYMDLVRTHVPRLLAQTPRSGKRSIIAKAARLRRR